MDDSVGGNLLAISRSTDLLVSYSYVGNLHLPTTTDPSKLVDNTRGIVITIPKKGPLDPQLFQ